jgi:hypothetical protein
VKDEITKLRVAERKISEAMSGPMDALSRTRLLEARACVINVRVALMKVAEAKP